eukprot:TRINITY_DN211_c0_g2_i1.p1 TRINITY_DN211_c0_g2~~TRINITY_DN211_c0_g2_i1.p1  ORF type:complete len:134 (+),score=3.01 TRINITY_DN211_c0_g2_i1:1722-2123(+)
MNTLPTSLIEPETRLTDTNHGRAHPSELKLPHPSSHFDAPQREKESVMPGSNPNDIGKAPVENPVYHATAMALIAPLRPTATLSISSRLLRSSCGSSKDHEHEHRSDENSSHQLKHAQKHPATARPRASNASV